MIIGGGQIRGALFNFFCREKVPFFVSSGRCPQFLKQPLLISIILKRSYEILNDQGPKIDPSKISSQEL